MSKIRKGDEVIVRSGRDKGKRGEVLGVRRTIDKRTLSSSKKKIHIDVLVAGVNLVTHHVKPNPQIQEPGGIKKKEAFLDSSKVLLFNPTTKKGERVGYRFLEDGRKVRYFKNSNQMVDKDQE